MANNSVATATAPLDAVVVNFELRKLAGRALDDYVIISQANEIADAVNKKSQEWVAKYQSHREYRNDNGSLYYAVFMTLTGPATSNSQLLTEGWLSQMAAKGAKSKGQPYIIHSVNGETYVPMTAEEKAAAIEAQDSQMLAYAEVVYPENPMSYFKVKGHELFGLDPQIRNVLRIVKTAIDSEFRDRFHAVLVGPPGCGKTSLLKILENMFGKKAVLMLDGTSMTSAGVQKLFLEELSVLPRFIIIEEIEKADPAAVQFLLGMMDDRGEIRKNTARRNVQQDAKVIVFATANNWEKLCNMQEGAVASRFGGESISFTEATDEQLVKILTQRINNFPSGKLAWIKPTLTWCQKIGNRDPRYVQKICLTGRDELLDGTYQADLEATLTPEMRAALKGQPAPVSATTVNYSK